MVKVLDRVVQRYFVYRSAYVQYFRDEAPNRVGWAIASEVIRLAFQAAGALFFAFVLGALTIQAAGRPGHAGWAFPFGLLAALALGAALTSARSLGTAARALSGHRQLLKK